MAIHARLERHEARFGGRAIVIPCDDKHSVQPRTVMIYALTVDEANLALNRIVERVGEATAVAGIHEAEVDIAEAERITVLLP